jgi:4-amino-4-deoxy-L-arabinose transferase-like glycosyltransferase
MAHFISASVNPDGMLVAFWSLVLWLGVRVLRRGLTPASGAALAAAAAGAALTKATGYVAVAGAAGVILFALWSGRGAGLRRVSRVAVVCAAVGILPLAGWLVAARLSDRPAVNQVANTSGQTVSVFHPRPGYLASYLWQFYLPKAGFLRDVPGMVDDYGYEIWFRNAWGVFGWKDTYMPNKVYSALRWISYAVLLAAAVALVRRRVRIPLAVGVFLGGLSLALVAGLHWTEFRFIVERGELFMQGRYLLPLLPVGGCLAAAALMLVPLRARGAAVGVGLGALVGLQLLALGTVLERYYA